MDLDWTNIRAGKSTDVGCHFMNDLAQCWPTEDNTGGRVLIFKTTLKPHLEMRATRRSPPKRNRTVPVPYRRVCTAVPFLAPHFLSLVVWPRFGLPGNFNTKRKKSITVTLLSSRLLTSGTSRRCQPGMMKEKCQITFFSPRYRIS